MECSECDGVGRIIVDGFLGPYAITCQRCHGTAEEPGAAADQWSEWVQLTTDHGGES